jgi:hypothetical protein
MDETRRVELMMSSPVGRGLMARRAQKAPRRPPPLSGSWDAGLRAAVSDARAAMEEHELRAIPDHVTAEEANRRLKQSADDIKGIANRLIERINGMVL